MNERYRQLGMVRVRRAGLKAGASSRSPNASRGLEAQFSSMESFRYSAARGHGSFRLARSKPEIFRGKIRGSVMNEGLQQRSGDRQSDVAAAGPADTAALPDFARFGGTFTRRRVSNIRRRAGALRSSQILHYKRGARGARNPNSCALAARNVFRSGVGCRELRKRRNNNRRYSREKTFRESVIGDYRRYARFCSKMRFERLMQGCYTEAMTTAALMKAD